MLERLNGLETPSLGLEASLDNDISNLFKSDFLYSCASVNTISTDRSVV